MKIRELIKTDPDSAIELLNDIRSAKVMGPWTEASDPGGAFGWTFYYRRSSLTDNSVALQNGGHGSWHVHLSSEDDQPDTFGDRKACDNYLRARGWILIADTDDEGEE